ncbi:hypothetical protein NQ314_001682 [Rhamnusium bicolor]|uniref:Chitin-binding type-2 domain-containing protein n=1 Tax=Rhamnusium bicolor TaxID=1586634 RepID=A0AAV8ZTM3_9CUCU|nr:hypothetical protein NQ314_001682 [Rhamnusium bicolor]
MVPGVIEFCFFFVVFFTVEAEVNCPATNPAQPDILPDRQNCTRFFICDNGTPWMQHCADGLYFNPTLKVCDRPENVVFCEYNDIFYIKPHCDCSKYVTCDYGNLSIRDCAKGYHFNLLGREASDYSDPCQRGNCE